MLLFDALAQDKEVLNGELLRDREVLIGILKMGKILDFLGKLIGLKLKILFVVVV